MNRMLLTIALILISLPGPAGFAQPPAGDEVGTVQEALRQMAELEHQLEQAGSQQLSEESALLKEGGRLKALEEDMARRQQLEHSGQQYLQSYEEQARQQLEELEQERQEKTAQLRSTRQGARLACVALLEQASAPAPDAATAGALGLLLETRRTQARLADSRLLRLETQSQQARESSLQAQRIAEHHTIFTQYGLDQLRRRHQELATRVEQLQQNVEERSQDVAQLRQRRQDLSALIQDLAQQSAGQPEAEETPLATEQEETESETPMVATGQEGGETMDREQIQGARRLFWRATPVGVRAVAAGRVVFSGEFAGYRHLLILDHGGGWRTLYGNQTQCTLQPGEQVTIGQPLGIYQAAQGDRAEPFWFEVRQGTQTVPPEQWPALPTLWEQKIFAPVETTTHE